LAQTWSESMLETMYTVLPFPLLTQTQGAFPARRWVVLDRGRGRENVFGVFQRRGVLHDFGAGWGFGD
jgi:hypothetical protein